MESERERCSSPELCRTAVQTINDSCSPLIEYNVSSIQNIDGNKSKSKNNSSSLPEIYSELIKEDCSKSMADKTSSSRICTKTNQTKNDSSSTLLEANILSTEDKKLNFRRVPINHQHPKSSNHSFSNSKVGVTNESRLV